MSGSVQEPVNYALSWNTVYWTIKSSAVSSANLRGPSVQGAWNVKISGDDVISGPATVFRAAYRYWHKMPALGLTAPDLGRKVRITCHNSVGFTYYWNGKELSASGLFHPVVNSDADPDIEVACKRNASYVFGTVAHEIGHAAHYAFNPKFNGKTNALIKESWAQFTRYILTETEYKDLGLYGKLHKSRLFNPNQHLVAFQVPDYYNQQMWYLGLGAERDETVRLYTPMFVDLYDTFNQNKWYGYWSPGRTKDDLDRTPDDDICMLTIREIQEIAFGSKNKSEAIGWIRQYAARYGFTSEEIDRYWAVYSLIEDEDYDRYK